MIFFCALPRDAAHLYDDLTLTPRSERQIVSCRLRAARRVRRKRTLLRLGLGGLRRLTRALSQKHQTPDIQPSRKAVS